MRAPMRFANRQEAGQRLGASLARCGLVDPLIFAIPPGGVVVGAAVANRLAAPLYILMVRKITAPGLPEYAVGAVTDGSDPQIVVLDAAARCAGASMDFIQGAARRQLAEIESAKRLYGPHKGPQDLSGRNVIVVVDGVATGATAIIALQALRNRHAARLIIGVPVASPDCVRRLQASADDVICLYQDPAFLSVPRYYDDFRMIPDAEVASLLEGHQSASS